MLAQSVPLFQSSVGMVGATVLAATAGGFFTGTAPQQCHDRNCNTDEGKERLPFHVANITAKRIRATGFFGGVPAQNCHKHGQKRGVFWGLRPSKSGPRIGGNTPQNPQFIRTAVYLNRVGYGEEFRPFCRLGLRHGDAGKLILWRTGKPGDLSQDSWTTVGPPRPFWEVRGDRSGLVKQDAQHGHAAHAGDRLGLRQLQNRRG